MSSISESCVCVLVVQLVLSNSTDDARPCEEMSSCVDSDNMSVVPCVSASEPVADEKIELLDFVFNNASCTCSIASWTVMPSWVGASLALVRRRDLMPVPCQDSKCALSQSRMRCIARAFSASRLADRHPLRERTGSSFSAPDDCTFSCSSSSPPLKRRTSRRREG